MRPASEALTARRNAGFGEEWAFTDGGLPVDLTGYSGRLEVRRYGAEAGSPTLVAGSTNGPGPGVRIVAPATLGAVEVTIARAALAAAYQARASGGDAGAAVPLVYDLRMTAPDGREEIWVEGPFTILPGVTIGG